MTVRRLFTQVKKESKRVKRRIFFVFWFYGTTEIQDSRWLKTVLAKIDGARLRVFCVFLLCFT
jgi:hypothetical protein